MASNNKKVETGRVSNAQSVTECVCVWDKEREKTRNAICVMTDDNVDNEQQKLNLRSNHMHVVNPGIYPVTDA